MSSEETVTEKIKELKPEILKYIPEALYLFRYSLIEGLEKEYREEMEKCSINALAKQSKLTTAISDLSGDVAEKCVEILASKEKPEIKSEKFYECSQVSSKIHDLIEWNARKTAEELKKCGCQFK
jgi:hypothetical protein